MNKRAKGKEYISHTEFNCPDSHHADELAIAFLHAGFTVHIETLTTSFGPIRKLVCVDIKRIEASE